jgi:hypothetical protein
MVRSRLWRKAEAEGVEPSEPELSVIDDLRQELLEVKKRQWSL